MKSYRLGAVPYLNALPLIHFLKERPLLAPPAVLARLLGTGELDLATAPIVTLFENPHYTLVPGICVASDGPVQSVRCFFRSPEITLENIRSIGLDGQSRTSVALLKVLLRFRFGRRLEEIAFFPRDQAPDRTDACLLIGDKAMRNPPEGGFLDLGEEWTAWTGLPFVYAAWVSRLPKIESEVILELTRARDEGMEKLRSVIPDNPSFSPAFIEEYLRKLIYRMGPREERGMELFRKYASR